MNSAYASKDAETGRESVNIQPALEICRSTSASGGSIAKQNLSPVRFGTSTNFRKLVCFDHTYDFPSKTMFFPLFSQVRMVVQGPGGRRSNGHSSKRTGGRVGRQFTPQSGTIHPGPPTFSP